MKKTYALMALAMLGLTVDADAQSAAESRLGERGSVRKGATAHSDTGSGLRGGGATNDECGGAIALTVGAECSATPATLLGATESLPSSTCSGYTASQAYDVWFSFVAAAPSQVIRVEAVQDVVLEILEGDCEELNPLNCVDAGSNGEALLATGLVANNTYYVRVYAYSATVNDPDFTICVYNAPPPPANDNCAGAVPVTLGEGEDVDFTGTTAGATPDGDFAPTSPLAEDGSAVVWHAFTLTAGCSDVYVSYCNTEPAFQLILARLGTACPVDDVIVRDGITWSCANGGAEFVYYNLPAGTYYMPVLFDIEDANGAYSINVSTTACSPYCLAGASDGTFESIGEVTIGSTFSNLSTSTVGYEDFTALSIDLALGSTNTATVIIDGPYDVDQVLLWIDLDQSNSFEANELLWTSDIGEGPHEGSISIPSDAPLGPTRLRIRLHDTEATPNEEPCGNSGYGQVEDYTANIVDIVGIHESNGPAFSIFPNPTDGDITISAGDLAGDVLFEITDMTGRVVYQHQVMASGQLMTLPMAGKVAAGMYNLSLISNGARSVRSVVVR